MCRSQQQQSENPDAPHFDSAVVNSDFFLRLTLRLVLEVSRLGRSAAPCLFWHFHRGNRPASLSDVGVGGRGEHNQLENKTELVSHLKSLRLLFVCVRSLIFGWS